MSRQQVEKFFKEYVFGFIFTDIQREIELGRQTIGGGNLLAALGLLCYTEFMGGVKRGIIGRGEAAKNFNAFFDSLGPAYAEFRKQVDVYDVFRCGIAHEYLVKGDCEIAMLQGNEPCGIGQHQNGRYYFVVERYFEDFKSSCRGLYTELMAQPNPVLPKRVALRPRRKSAKPEY